MKLQILTSIAVVTGLLSGCAGNLYTHTSKSSTCVEDDGKCTGVYKGITYRPLLKYTETYTQDRVLDSKGVVTHFAGADGDKACVPTVVTEEKLIPDPDNEYMIQYDPAFFETSTFTVKLSPLGTLSEVGTSSTPGGKALVESFTGLATTIKTLNHGPVSSSFVDDSSNKLLCSHGKVFLSE
ncbi:hypothetical protein Q4493_15950 [Colwellia sp. 1_MG-2023]|uniref:hypothetical protein n=1 Tax=Colwellia sp. 1_MG-2023 TaxID=3062649 RepID=UPI0026E24777|nr:hypothetical protein [Colwellia sp. 1_MG-2023]MDO6447263.1 hypothetical protein [Colwellia sp. 1_MG-2023]